MTKTVSIVTALALGYGLLAAPANAAESAYTDVNLDACTTIAEEPEQESFVSLKCPGYGSYPFYFKEGDLRQAVFFGHLDQRILDEAFESFGPFNHIGGKIEWRLGSDGKPFATILRYFIENANPDSGVPDKAHEGQVLVISRVGQPGDMRGCVVGYVDARANPKANVLAREIADEKAASFGCGWFKPVFYGAKSESSGEPMLNFPALDD